ncbi:MAG: hypothetical protein R2824_03050 [Saprospiraceae bacterium]|nr:hypothetical protein [Lewinella sp.]
MRNIFFCLILLLTGINAFGQIKDTILQIEDQAVTFDLDLSLPPPERTETVERFRKEYENNLRTSTNVQTLFSSIPLSSDGCNNHGFESGYAGWTGLSLKHGLQMIPIEDGLINNPGIALLPFTATGSGGNYTALATTGPDPLIAGLQMTSNLTPSTDAIRLGNNAPGFGAEGVAKRFVVTNANAKYYFQYAVVMDPSHSNSDGSMNGSEVFFVAEAIDQAGNTVDKVVEVGNPSNPFVTQVNTTAGSKYTRNWRCVYLDLSSHIGQEVMVMFINSDCSAGAHKGYTYLDETCEPCKNLNEGDIGIDLDPDACLAFPQLINGTFSLPNTNNVLSSSISLLIYQNGVLLSTVTSPTISGNNYSFSLSPGDFPAGLQDPCFDVVAKLTFQIQDINGNVTTIERWSSDVSSSIEGELPGLNNDICYCVDCCQTPLDIRPSQVTPAHNINVQGTALSTANQTFTIGTNAAIPITEIRVAVTDIVFDYNYEQCGDCIDNPALWGSIETPTAQIGTAPQSLPKQGLPYYSGNLVGGRGNLREVIWRNGNGAMLQSGDSFEISYWLPPLSAIPCCATKVTICLEISWKDANCQVCTEQVCTQIVLSGGKEGDD